MYSSTMYYPKGYGFKRISMGLSIAVLTLGGIMSFGLGQALGHWHTSAGAPTHRAATTTQQAIASGALSQQAAGSFYPASVAVSRPTHVAADRHGHERDDSHHKDGAGRSDGQAAPSPKEGSITTAGGDNGQ
jgi:hypothetical protein